MNLNRMILAFGVAFVFSVLSGNQFVNAMETSHVIRATELGKEIWQIFEKGKISTLTVEFRQGDRLPVKFQAQGDLLETDDSTVSHVIVRKQFWLRLKNDNILMSLDGTKFKAIKKLIEGSLAAGANGDLPDGGAANAINVLFKAYLK
ncbi:MAG: hypothetical protein AAB425_08235 [Bdellovibrionota bacterium]